MALEEMLRCLPEAMPPIVIVQHIPERFSGSFALRLDKLCRLRVSEARDGERLADGRVYVAQGAHHLAVRRDNGALVCHVFEAPKVNGHRPSVSVLFDSVAATCGHLAVGVIMTGMGRDGADGMFRMRRSGARTIAQDEASSVVWSMPKAAIDLGAVQSVVPLAGIARALVGACASA